MIFGNFDFELEFRGKHGYCSYMTKFAVGADVTSQDLVYLPSGERALVGTGVFIKYFRFLNPNEPLLLLPEFQIRPRSGLSKKGIDVSLGTVDGDYIGHEIKACIVNNSNQDFNINYGDRIGQLVCALTLNMSPMITRHNEERTGGFGSTGK